MSDSETITIVVNEGPTNLTLSDSSVAENQPVGALVGGFIPTDADLADTFNYALVSGVGSGDNASFSISGSSLTTATSFDYETRSSYNIRVRATDQGGLYCERPLTITIVSVLAPDDSRINLTLSVGDISSDSHSERWALHVGDTCHSASSFGVLDATDYVFRTGMNYDVTLQHLGTDPEYLDEHGSPDYDWEADITAPFAFNPPFFVIDDNTPLRLLGPYQGEDMSEEVTGNAGFYGKHATLVTLRLDADVDSANDSGFAVPDDNQAEDFLEQDISTGKIVRADTGGPLVPMALRLSQNVTQTGDSSVPITIWYQNAVLRLWKTAARNPGDEIESGQPHDLGLNAGGTVTVYMEALQGWHEVMPIEVAADVESSRWTGRLTDTVHVMAAEVADDAAYTGYRAPVEIYVLSNDVFPDPLDVWTITQVVGTQHGQAVVSGQMVIYTPNASFTSGTDTFQYTIENGYGASVSANVTVTMVDVMDYRLEWKNPEGDWTLNQPDETCWADEQLSWTPMCSTVLSEHLESVQFASQAWSAFQSGGQAWYSFAFGSGLSVEGNPGVGDWAIQAGLTFSGFENQSSFTAVATQPKEQVVARIVSINWVPYSNPTQAGTLVGAGDEIQFFPDSDTPGGALRTKVGVDVVVEPAIAGIRVAVEQYDVDDPSRMDNGPLQDNVNRPDNLGDNPKLGLIVPATDEAGHIHATATFLAPLPGNNYRLAVTKERGNLLKDVKPLVITAEESELYRQLFYDTDGDGMYNFGNEPSPDVLMDSISPHKGIHVSPEIAVWRRMHLELDSMGPVVGNYLENRAASVRSDTAEDYFVVTLATPLSAEDAVTLSEDGTLEQDGRRYPIISASTTEITVSLLYPAVEPPQVNVDVKLYDDDDQTLLPAAPDVSLVTSQFAEAFIEVVVDGGGNPANNETNHPFIANMTEEEMGKEYDGLFSEFYFQSKSNRSDGYWVGWIKSAYQGPEDRDNDSNSEVDSLFGAAVNYTGDTGAAFIFMETTRDICSHITLNGNRLTDAQITLVMQRVVLHELTHEFQVPDRPLGANPGVMDYNIFANPGNSLGSLLSATDLRQIRLRNQGPGR